MAIQSWDDASVYLLAIDKKADLIDRYIAGREIEKRQKSTLLSQSRRQELKEYTLPQLEFDLKYIENISQEDLIGPHFCYHFK